MGPVEHSPEQSAVFMDQAYMLDLRGQMLRFAILQLSDDTLAEDAVQEAMLGAMKNADSFSGRAAFKTWVFAILKHKIADMLRHRQRETNHISYGDDEIAKSFDENGHWHAAEQPAHWVAPDAAIQNEHFWQVFDTCLEHLPAQQARVFMMREFIELGADEVCTSLGISVTNLHVILYRARLRLRKCLENNWFSEEVDCTC